MKKNILLTLCVVIISIASFNMLSYHQTCDCSINQIGGAAIYYGLKGESPTFTDVGGIVASAGGAALTNSGGLVCGAAWAMGSNPIGWAIGGAALVL